MNTVKTMAGGVVPIQMSQKYCSMVLHNCPLDSVSNWAPPFHYYTMFKIKFVLPSASHKCYLFGECTKKVTTIASIVGLEPRTSRSGRVLQPLGGRLLPSASLRHHGIKP